MIGAAPSPSAPRGVRGMPELTMNSKDCGCAADGGVAPLRKTPDPNGSIFVRGWKIKLSAYSTWGRSICNYETIDHA